MKLMTLSFIKPGRSFLAIAVALAALVALYATNLGNTPPINNTLEQPNYLQVESPNDFKNNIVYAPQRMIDFGLVSQVNASGVYFRAVSISLVVLSVSLFFFLIRQWVSRRVSWLATALFASSSWVIFDARWGEPDAMLLLVMPALLLAGSLLRDKKYDRLLPFTTLLTMLSLFVPGVWLLLLIGISMSAKDILAAWKGLGNLWRLLWTLSVALPLAALIYGLSSWQSTKQWLGIPESFNLSQAGDNLLELPRQLLISGIPDATVWLPGTPILDITTAALVVLGVVFVFRDATFPIRRYVLLIFAIVSLAMIGLHGDRFISLLLPLLYLFAAMGITLLFQQWFHIFPRNPLARSLGVALLTVVIVLTCSYHIARYHYVWPRSHAASVIFER